MLIKCTIAYFEHYYECGDEQTDVDKDLFGDGSGCATNYSCIFSPRVIYYIKEKCYEQER